MASISALMSGKVQENTNVGGNAREMWGVARGRCWWGGPARLVGEGSQPWGSIDPIGKNVTAALQWRRRRDVPSSGGSPHAGEDGAGNGGWWATAGQASKRP